MKLHFQVTFMDKKDYIIGFQNFKWNELTNMIQFIAGIATRGDVQTIKITRWNKEGNKA